MSSFSNETSCLSPQPDRTSKRAPKFVDPYRATRSTHGNMFEGMEPNPKVTICWSVNGGQLPDNPHCSLEGKLTSLFYEESLEAKNIHRHRRHFHLSREDKARWCDMKLAIRRGGSVALIPPGGKVCGEENGPCDPQASWCLRRRQGSECLVGTRGDLGHDSGCRRRMRDGLEHAASTLLHLNTQPLARMYWALQKHNAIKENLVK